MKGFALTLGAIAMAATAVTAVPASARAQTGCAWWDLTCNGLAQAISDYGWHIAGRDQARNVVYLRRVVDANGNVVFEQATRNAFGHYVVVNNHVLRKGTVYGPNGEICKYSSNDKGYKEECKYAKPPKPLKPEFTRHKKGGSALEVKRSEPVHYEAPKPGPGKYKAPKVESQHPGGVDVKGAKEVKPKDAKDAGKEGKGPKH